MRLDPGLTSISVDEEVEYYDYWLTRPPIEQRYWLATLRGVSASVNAETVTMSRAGDSPDEAMRKLFEAMSDAGVTL